MKRQCTFLLALAVAIVSDAGSQRASAQLVTGRAYQNNGRAYQTAANYAPPAQAPSEELPPVGAHSEGPFRDDPIVSEIHGGPHDTGAYYDEGYCDDGYCDSGHGCGNGCGNECKVDSWCLSGGQCFFTADYIYARASFSEATAFVEVEDNGNETESEYVPLEYDYDSSFRVGGGYRLCCCGDEIRFMYTQLSSFATDEAEPGDIVPYEAPPPPGGETEISSDVDVKSYDLEFRKRIPLGGECCGCDCGDACGGECGEACGGACSCCDPCKKCCPAWDLTWSGGFRYAEADWNRVYAALDDQEFAVTVGRADMEFDGGGVRTGLEGRRYFFKDGCFSIYMKGDISLLLGDVEVESSRAVNDPNQSVNPVTFDMQSFDTRQIIPVTEIEAGLTTNVSCHCAFTAGYLFSAWHDLGFRDEPELTTLFQPPTSYDDGNILGFDGFFARFEYAF